MEYIIGIIILIICFAVGIPIQRNNDKREKESKEYLIIERLCKNVTNEEFSNWVNSDPYWGYYLISCENCNDNKNRRINKTIWKRIERDYNY